MTPQFIVIWMVFSVVIFSAATIVTNHMMDNSRSWNTLMVLLSQAAGAMVAYAHAVH